MARRTKIITISVPAEMAVTIEEVARAEHRTTSELLREALRHYVECRSEMRDRATMPSPAMPTVEEIKRRALPVLARYRARRAGLFGSVARAEADEGSDVDMLVELDRSLNLFDFVGLKQDLEEALGRKVDLVEYHTLKPLIREQVLQEEVPIL